MLYIYFILIDFLIFPTFPDFSNVFYTILIPSPAQARTAAQDDTGMGSWVIAVALQGRRQLVMQQICRQPRAFSFILLIHLAVCMKTISRTQRPASNFCYRFHTTLR